MPQYPDVATNRSETVDFDFALIGLLDHSLSDDIVPIQCAGGFDLLQDLVGRVLAFKGEGEDIVYC
jgi:hypothetical protein